MMEIMDDKRNISLSISLDGQRVDEEEEKKKKKRKERREEKEEKKKRKKRREEKEEKLRDFIAYLTLHLSTLCC